MKVGIITTPNSKGQIVIPKAIREALGINANTPVNLQVRGDGLYIHPVREVITEHESQDSYLKILEKTAGSWKGDNWFVTERRRKKIELAASARRKREEW